MSGREPVEVPGYEGEPYLRLLPGGRVLVNERSPSHHANGDRFAEVAVPASADADAEPVWREVARTGRYAFHDHRIHWMSRNDPPQVAGAEGRTKIFDWTVPVRVGGRDAQVAGTLWWRGESEGGGAPTGALAALGAIALAGSALVLVVRRRRRAPREAREAW